MPKAITINLKGKSRIVAPHKENPIGYNGMPYIYNQNRPDTDRHT